MQRFLVSLLLLSLVVNAYEAPFTTDADLAGYMGDLGANVISSGGTHVFQHEGIEAVEIDGGLARVLERGHDWVRVSCSAGPHRVRLRCGERRPVPAPGDADSTALMEQFKKDLENAKPGDEVVVPNGTYLNWRVTIACSGTVEKPVVVRPQTPAGVTFMRGTRFTITGSHVVFRNFRFVQTADLVVRIMGGDRNRLTQLQFFHCGTSTSTFANIVRIENESDENRIDHCYWTGSKCMSVSLRSAFEKPELIGKHNRIGYNIFRDIERIWINGQEAVQLGQGFPWDARPETYVQHNLFDNVWGDSETFSSKTSGNIFRYNVAANCLKSGFCLRGGNDALVEGNVLINNAAGIRAFGCNHRIVNNLFIGNRGPAVVLQTGHLDGRSHGYPSTNQLIANNTMVNNAGGIAVQKLIDREDWRPIGNRFINNIFVGQTGTYINPEGQREPVAQRNLFQPGPGVQAGFAGEGAIEADAKLMGEGAEIRPSPDSPALDAAVSLPDVKVDRYGKPRPVGKAADLGAEEIGADPSDRPFLPPIPEIRTWDLSFFQAESIGEVVGAEPSEGNVSFDGPLPDDFVLTFEFRPQSFQTEGSAAFQGGGPKDGYQLRWGGADDKGIPLGLVHLTKRDVPVGEGPDTVYYRRNYVPSFPNKTVAIHRTEPFPDLWYEGRLLVYRGRIRFSLNIAQRAEENPRSVGRYPTIVWEDHGQVAGSVPSAGGAQLSCTKGKGVWRNVRLWKARDLRRLPPVSPSGLVAKPMGPTAMRLSWGDPDGFASSRVHEVYRGDVADFPLDAAHRIASGLGMKAFEDFAVSPGSLYYYCVRSRNLAGDWSQAASVTSQTPATGPLFSYCGAADFVLVDFPMSLGRDPEAALDYISGQGTPRRMKGPGEDGYADVSFTVPKDGTYVLWGLVEAPDSGSDSFYLSMPELNEGKPVPYYTGTGTWFWSRLPIPDGTVFKQGEHQLRLHIRESRTRLAAILVTDQLDWKPTGP